MSLSKLLPAFAFTLALLFASGAMAEEKVIDGLKVVKTEGNKLFVMKGEAQHSAEVASDAKITIDGKDAKLEDLKEGHSAKVTLEKGDSGLRILKVEATSK